MGVPEAESSASGSLRERRRESSHQNQPPQLTDLSPWGPALRQLPRPAPPLPPPPPPLPPGPAPPLQPPPRPPSPPLPMEHLLENARNCVNVHGDTLRLEVDEQRPDHHLISFGFDAPCDGRFTIFYFAKEKPNCEFIPVISEDYYVPAKVPFQDGLGQKFRQPSGTGIDLGFFALEELSTPSLGEDVFPLVIFAETFVPSSSPCMQVIQAVIDKNDDKNAFDVRVIKQTFWIDGFSFKREEMYGITNSTAESFKDGDSGTCVICLDKPNDTIVLPCGHMCMCSECVEKWRIYNDTCPICRKCMEKVIINNIDHKMGVPEAESSTSGSLRERRGISSHQNQPPQLTDLSLWGPALRQLPRQALPLPRPALAPRLLPMEHLLEKAWNCVNVHGDTLRLEVDEQRPDHHLISFGFDAPCDGRFTIFYFAKEKPNCEFIPVISEDYYVPAKVPFQDGLGQKFRQPSGTGIDLGFFALEELSTPSLGEDVFPLVIFAETFVPSSSPCMQVIQAVIDKNDDKNAFDVRVIKQTFWIDGFSFKREEMYGITNSTAESFKDGDSGTCVICLDKPNDTIVLPCGHMCMCSECVEKWRLYNDTCPICRKCMEKVVINNIDQ
ncbi:uncharacterized protein LOC127799950 [Diospyros lotus]|uniref:uncharacterized protein LOC127799950 n=1 Tax=Diospyros lotus TaxID=55363 RepID=UPI0022519230|nr:uncharacterized protein LOC127799950 [Diospyros lotus]